jgi:hypothetical protein
VNGETSDQGVDVGAKTQSSWKVDPEVEKANATSRRS